MSRNTQFYSQNNHSVVVSAADGSWSRVLKDFMEGDCIEWEPNGDRVTVTEGFDRAAISFSSAKSGQIRAHLKPTSSDVGFLTKVFNLNRTQPQLLNVVITTGVNETHKLFNAGVFKGAGNTGGTIMTERLFTFVGEELNEDESE